MSIRISYKNKVNNELNILKKLIQKNKDSIISLRNSDLQLEFITTKVEKIIENINKKNEEVRILEQKILDTDSGKLDEEIENDIKKNTLIASNKTLETKQKKLIIKDISIEDKTRMNIFIKNEKTANRNNKYENKNYESSFKYFCKISDKLPNNIIEKLKDMPNNKGYIIRDSFFFGEKANDNSGILTMFEKKYNEKNILYIHEYSMTEHKIYKKIDKNKKFLFSTVLRKIIN